MVGCGQLGSRHAQSLAKHPGLTEISLVEPMPESRETAIQRVRQTGFLGPIRTLSSVSDLNGSFSLTVLSTSSKDRLQTLRQIPNTVRSEYFLLEKLLAPNLAALEETALFLEGRGNEIWVNCPMPYYPHYSELLKIIELEKAKYPVDYKVTVAEIGLASNGVHYLDHFYRITGRTVSSPNFSSECRPVRSKRQGYDEVTGLFTSNTEFGDQLEVRFVSPAGGPLQNTKISCGSHQWEFDEIQQSFRHVRAGRILSSGSFQTPLQSDLTHLSLERLQRGQLPHWSDVETSLSLHRKLFHGLSRFQVDGRPLDFT